MLWHVFVKTVPNILAENSQLTDVIIKGTLFHTVSKATCL